MEGDTGPIQSHVAVSHSACWSATASRLYIPIQQVVTLFSALHTSPAIQNFLFPHLSLLFSIYLFFFKLTSDFFSTVCLREGVWKMALLCRDSDSIPYCGAALVGKVAESCLWGCVFCEITKLQS